MSSSSDVSFIRWLEQNNMCDYIDGLNNLGIKSISNLLSLTHLQLIEVGRQLGCSSMRQVLFAESIINNNLYIHKTTILNDNTLSGLSDSGVVLSYKLLNLLKKLSKMGPRDNWDTVTEEIYQLIDETKNLRLLISSIEEALKIDKNNYIAWDLNGLINARRGFLADARVAFQRSLVKNPNYLNARFNHARLLHYELNEYQRAKSEYQCIIRVKPNFSRAYNSYAKLLEKLGDLEMAEKYFRIGIQLRPKSISYRHCLANILSSQHRHFEVQQIYQEAVEQHPKSATLRFHHALALVKCKYFSESEMEFKNAIKLNGKNAQIYHEYAKFCERHREPRDYKRATDLYFKACQTDPINFLSAAVDAANLMRRLDTKQSLQSSYKLFEKLVIEAPHLNGAFLGFSKLLVRQKKYQQASKILINGLQHHPNDKLLNEYLNKLNNNKLINNNRPSILYMQQTQIPIDINENSKTITTNTTNTNTNTNGKSYSNISTLSFNSVMSEDINTPPLPNKHIQLHSTSNSINSKYGRISHLLNKNADLSNQNNSPYPTLNEENNTPTPPPQPTQTQIQPLKTNNNNNNNNKNPLKQHRQSIRNKIIIPENDIFNQSDKNNNNKMASINNNNKLRSAPRTSQQFNPKTILEKRKSQQFQSSLPTINQHPELKKKRSSISHNVQTINIINHNLNQNNPKETCLVM